MRRPVWLLLAASAVWPSAQGAPPKLAISGAMLHEQREDGPQLSVGYEYVPGELLYLSFLVGCEAEQVESRREALVFRRQQGKGGRRTLGRRGGRE